MYSISVLESMMGDESFGARNSELEIKLETDLIKLGVFQTVSDGLKCRYIRGYYKDDNSDLINNVAKNLSTLFPDSVIKVETNFDENLMFDSVSNNGRFREKVSKLISIAWIDAELEERFVAEEKRLNLEYELTEENEELSNEELDKLQNEIIGKIHMVWERRPDYFE